MSDLKLDKRFRNYLRSPIRYVIILAAVDLVVFAIDLKAGMVMLAGIAVYLAAQFAVYERRKNAIFAEMVEFASRYGQIEGNILKNTVLPYAIANESGRILWFNDAFGQLAGLKEKEYGKSLYGVFRTISSEKLPGSEDEVSEFEIEYNDSAYKVEIVKTDVTRHARESSLIDVSKETGSCIYTVSFQDITELHRYIDRYHNEMMVTALIYLDNYEEALESVEEVRRSLLIALIDRKITKYFSNFDGLVKKFEKDKFMLVMRRSSLKEVQQKQFSILEEVKTVNIGNDMSVTVSMGIGANNGSYTQDYEAARIAIDLALGRGGDQVVIKDEAGTHFFGGQTQAVEKNTRVKARVKAHALKEFIASKEKVVCMGHQMIDADAFGAAIGIYRAARALNKKSYVVIDQVTSSIRPLMNLFEQAPDYDENMFLTREQAKEMVNDETLVVVVDTSRPSYTGCPELLRKTKTIVVLDHHRQSEDVIKNAVLSYIEPYASSACEMVAEILQYFSDGIRIRNIEADALYAGIMVDTDNFLQKTGVRTFEAAAFLRRSGADVTRVRKMFREEMLDSKVKGETVSNAEMYRDHYAISISPKSDVDSPTIIASQSANELLNIIDVKASFVLTDYQNKIYISARAIDEVNVQRIMERLGGGGHLNMAGCQLVDVSMDYAVEVLKKTLDDMINEGELK